MNTRHASLSAVLALGLATLLAACGGSATTPSPSQAPTPAPSVAPTPTPSVAPATATPAAAEGTPVEIAGFAFTPATVTIKVGETVKWTNNDGAPHTATAGDGSFDSGTLARGAVFSHTFTTAGTFTYACKIHSSMTATVVVE